MGSAASRDPGSSFEDTSRARRVPRQESRAKSIDSALIEAAASLSLATDARESSARPRAYRALLCSSYWRAQRIPASARRSSSRSLLAPSRVAELRDLDLWAYHRGVTLDFSRPGKPTDNAFIESFNGKFRAECLNAHWFMNLDDARRKCEAWRRDYNPASQLPGSWNLQNDDRRRNQ